MEKVIILLSGGMDSGTALVWALNKGFEIETISFNYGSKHNDMEYAYVQKLCAKYGVENKKIDLKFIENYFKSDLLKSGGEIPVGHYADPVMKKTVVPFRNGIMLSICAGLAESVGAKKIILGNHYGDHAIYPDCRKEFVDPMGQAIKEGTYEKIELLSPFVSLDKADIVRLGNSLQLDYSLTYSCYTGNMKHCGVCGTCYERKEAFKVSNTPDPTVYEN